MKYLIIFLLLVKKCGLLNYIGEEFKNVIKFVFN